MDLKFNLSDEHEDFINILDNLEGDCFAISKIGENFHNVEAWPMKLNKLIDKMVDYVYTQSVRRAYGEPPEYDLDFEREFIDTYFDVLGFGFVSEIGEDIDFYLVYRINNYSLIFISILQFNTPKSDYRFESNQHVCRIFEELKRNG